MSTVTIDTIATESFYNHFRSDSIREIHNYCEDVWETYIEDGSGDYSADFYLNDGTDIPSSAFNMGSNDNLWDRADQADDWLQTHLAYNYTDLILVCDYWGGDSMNGASQEVAGTYENKVSILDTDNANYIGGPMDAQGPKGVMAHEMLHMFIEEGKWSSEHYPFVNSSDEASLMYDASIQSWCYDYGSTVDVIKDVSYCTENKVQSWIDNNL